MGWKLAQVTRDPPQNILTQYGLSNVTFVAGTGQAFIWRVCMPSGDSAALKIYKGADMGNESAGFVFLDALKGSAASHVYAHTKTLGLCEWLEGPALGDLTRAGADHDAAVHLGKVAQRIHVKAVPAHSIYPTLQDWFAPLFRLTFDPECAPSAKTNMRHAQQLARDLLGDQRDIRPLHGDLHHDNIRQTPRGYCCFDAKGVLGERTYELANAFRNPKGAEALVRDRERIAYLRDFFAAEFDVAPARLMRWACAKLALSITWRSKGHLKEDAELDLLERFLANL